jgi:hypothetical protein
MIIRGYELDLDILEELENFTFTRSRIRGNKYFVWVFIKVKQVEVFRGKFILVSFANDKNKEE